MTTKLNEHGGRRGVAVGRGGAGEGVCNATSPIPQPEGASAAGGVAGKPQALGCCGARNLSAKAGITDSLCVAAIDCRCLVPWWLVSYANNTLLQY